MKLLRRRFLHVTAGAVVSPALLRTASAAPYPTRPVRIIVGFAPGGPTDLVARLLGQWLSDRFGQQFIIENRTGAATNIATETVVRAPADGHTLLLTNAANAINATLHENLSYSFIRDIEQVAGIILSPLVMAVNPSLPAKTVPEFIAHAKANPGKISFASGGIGAPNHMAAELFKRLTGIDMIHIPYRGEALALSDLISGRVQVLFSVIGGSIEHLRAGRLRALAVTSVTRLPTLLHIPTVGEFVPDYEATQWYGIGAPKNTPADIVLELNTQINVALEDAKIKAHLGELSSMPIPMTPTELTKFVVAETDKWAKLVRYAGRNPQ
jgi:tripartite-type tricarboxylate transporter receptor subunit TctC